MIPLFTAPIIIALGSGCSICTRCLVTLLRAVGLLPKPVPIPVDVDMSGRVVLVTGANTGIGCRTALNLARLGAKVIMACRSVERGEEARAKMEAELRCDNRGHAMPAVSGVRVSGFRTVQVMKCDLGDLRSIRAFAKAFREKHGERLDVLVNNAGLLPGPLMSTTADGLDITFGVNFIGHFVLTTELLPIIEATHAARVVCLSSVLHRFGRTEWESSACGHGDHSKLSAYCDSKLAAVLFVKELRRRFVASGSSATAFSVNPGAVRSDIWRFLPRLLMAIHNLSMKVLFLDVERGCRVSVCTSAMPLASLSGSDYYQPYWLPFGCVLPFETMGPFVGCAPGRPSLPKDEPTVSGEMWAACERIVRAADAAREGTQTSPTS
ncbi:unnamed protein product [Ascophyllum nodosum]